MSLKDRMPLKEAMTETLNLAFPTIITSGAMMALAGMVIGLMTSNEIISGIGLYMGSGTTISIFLGHVRAAADPAPGGTCSLKRRPLR